MARSPNHNGTWRVRGVSVQGYSHLRDGVECQDAHRHVYEPRTGSYLLAVADGAGSRARSAEGATLAVGLALGEFGERLAGAGVPASGPEWHAWLHDGLAAIVGAFRDTSERLGASAGEFAATLTVAVLCPPWFGTVSVGDGIVIVGARGDDGEQRLHLITLDAAAGEYVNETSFLSSADALESAKSRCVRDASLTALVLATDGIVPIGVQRDGAAMRPNCSFMDPVLRAMTSKGSDPTEVTRLLLEDRISRVSADDKTLLVAVRT